MAQYPASSFTQKLNVTKSNTAGQVEIIGLGPTSVALTTVGSDYSSWVQYVASTGNTYVLTQVGLKLPNSFGASDFPMILQIGRGGAGSEAVLTELPVPFAASAPSFPVLQIPEPIRVASGSRVAVRLFVAATGAASVNVSLYGAVYSNLEGN